MDNLRMVVAFVGGVLLIGVAGIVYLASQGAAIPDVLVAVTSGALTGLVGLLVPARTRGGGQG